MGLVCVHMVSVSISLYVMVHLLVMLAEEQGDCKDFLAVYDAYSGAG